MGAFKLGKMTFGSLFKKPETVLYPVVTKPQPAGLKGHVAIEVNDCILCGMCDRSCSTDCITVDRQARTWTIDRLQCVQCGYCITVCPKKCLSMDPNYAPATIVHEPDVFQVPEQEKAGKKADEKPDDKPATEKPVAAADAKAEEPDEAKPDAQLMALIGLMDDEKAAKVRSALNV
ncbi:MAG: 4Fe-4S dicluster domain-containing protein [Eggerthellaceae bacterium]|nr:4Fe-4S dicluster domain-containing protein [Eggerthellaceae bacterium]